jgi:DNA-binding protein Alba
MNYVTAIIEGFTRSNSEEVTLKARGRAIKTAVDAAEITRRKFIKELTCSNIKIGTEELEQKEGGTKNVSTMEIILTKPPEKKKAAYKEEAKSSPTQAIEITKIEGVGEKRAEQIKSQGVKSVQDLAKRDPKKLSEKLQISEKRVSKWIEEAKKIINN